MKQGERDMLIDFIIDAVYEIEGHQMDIVEIAELVFKSDDELRKEADWYDYLLDK